MNRQINETINVAIMENEKSATDWGLHNLAWELYWWTDFFNIAFFREQPVPVPAISFERTKITNLGHYVVGRNAFGVRENININRAHLNRPLWDILATLLHELTHSWQYIYGKPSKSWFHNKEFQMKLLSFGILCDKKGCHIGIGDPFVHLLKLHAVSFDGCNFADGLLKVPPKPKKKGASKLRKWSCGCQNARVGKADFEATCDICGNKFELIT